MTFVSHLEILFSYENILHGKAGRLGRPVRVPVPEKQFEKGFSE